MPAQRGLQWANCQYLRCKGQIKISKSWLISSMGIIGIDRYLECTKTRAKEKGRYLVMLLYFRNLANLCQNISRTKVDVIHASDRAYCLDTFNDNQKVKKILEKLDREVRACICPIPIKVRKVLQIKKGKLRIVKRNDDCWKEFLKSLKLFEYLF